MPADRYGRDVSYLRLSITDRCNLRCLYCRSGEMKLMRHEDLLTFEETLDLIRAASSLGVRKVRLTGGEPLSRPGFLQFMERVAALPLGLDLRLTTNATLLPGKVKTLKDMGLTGLNISLDSLDARTFERVTGEDKLHVVLAAIDECLEQGLKLKLNVVALKGVNDHELEGFVRFAREHPVDVRFIEFMPIGGETSWRPEHFWPAEDIRRRASELADLVEEPLVRSTSGPARVWSIKGGRGRIGLISPLSQHFCRSCNRLRITSDGKLRTCLFSDREYRLKPALRSPKLGLEHVVEIMRLAGQRKPLGYEILEARREAAVCGRAMSAIGG